MAERVWSEKDLVRRANRRLAVLRHAEKVSGNVPLLRDQPQQPLPVETPLGGRGPGWAERPVQRLAALSDHHPPQVVEKIIHLRQHYHFGPLKIEISAARLPALQTPPEAAAPLRETAPPGHVNNHHQQHT